MSGAGRRETGTPGARRRIRPGTYAIVFLLFAAVVIPSHLWLARLPYYWDEAGQFIPTALDLFHDGSWVPHSTLPNIHPPGVPAYLAAVWRVFGCRVEATRLAMLVLASLGAMTAFLLAIELNRDSKGAPALVAAAALCVSPVFFAQSALAQLDAPAMLFTTLALLLFLEGHTRAAAAACVALVLVKETGAIVPVTLGAWLVKERRWREAAWFAAPLAALGAWIVVLARATGHWAGNAEFARYNLEFPLEPLRLLTTLGRRLYYLLFASFHWVGTAAVVYAWRKTRLFRSRPWQVAGSVAAAEVILHTLAGGAVLNRYLLPALPILFAAMAAAISSLPRAARIAATCLLLGGLAASNFINPPYPFAFEDNLAFADFIKVHQEAADYLSRQLGDRVVHTSWPMSNELARPELGYVPVAIRVKPLEDLTPQTLKTLDWRQVDVLVLFSKDWSPQFNLKQLAPTLALWRRFYDVSPNADIVKARERIPFPMSASFSRRGQWVGVYVNPESQ